MRLAALLWLGLAAGCGTPDEDRGGRPQEVAPVASEDSVDEAASRAGRPAAEELAETRPDPHRVRIYALNLVNRHPVEVVVMASAGAGRVVLDTVASMDSARVDIRLRADRVRLEATDAAGRTLATSEIALIPDTVQRWVARPRQRGETTGD